MEADCGSDRSAGTAAGTSLIFTFTPEPTVPPGFPMRVNDMVASGGGRVCWVQLEIGDVEQEHRIDAADRREFHKMTDLATLRRLRTEPDGEPPPADLVINTESSAAAASSARIIEHFALRTASFEAGYPKA